eukprot:378559-Ditylum_brightwellii.AAC.1
MPGSLAMVGTSARTKELPMVSIDTADYPFFDKQSKHFNIPLSPKGRALGIELSECDYYLPPYISRVKA